MTALRVVAVRQVVIMGTAVGTPAVGAIDGLFLIGKLECAILVRAVVSSWCNAKVVDFHWCSLVDVVASVRKKAATRLTGRVVAACGRVANAFRSSPIKVVETFGFVLEMSEVVVDVEEITVGSEFWLEALTVLDTEVSRRVFDVG